jgi:SAM-dependent methyltransferase
MAGSPIRGTVAVTVTDHAISPLAFTGERYTPEVAGVIGYEHWHRYAAVAPLAAGRRVLDAACGEGYGSALLARSAASVLGVDLAASAVAHATARYACSNLAFVQASVTGLPFAEASVDLIVSFETLEHLAAQREMLAEFRRVLAADGALILSSPNRPVYNDAGGGANHYHVRELDRGELAQLLAPLFPRQAWHAQRICTQSLLWAEGATAGPIRYLRAEGDAEAPAAPMYFIVIAGARDAPLPSLPALSVFDEGPLALAREHARALARERQLAWDELDARKVAEDRLAELVQTTNALASEQQKTAALRARVDALEAELARVVAALAQESREHAHTRARLAYRESPGGWARWPLGVARRRLAGQRS